MSEDKPYICINCKDKFKDLPVEAPNECPNSYYHMIVKIKTLDRITLKRKKVSWEEAMAIRAKRKESKR